MKSKVEILSVVNLVKKLHPKFSMICKHRLLLSFKVKPLRLGTIQVMGRHILHKSFSIRVL